MTDQALTTTEPQRPKPAMTVGGNVGALIPQDIEQAFRIASALAQSGMTPSGFKTPETCFVAIMAGAELGLPPFQSLQSFAIINNRPTLWGDALMAVVRTNGFKVREWMEGEGDTMEAFCEVIRPDNGDVAEASFSVDDAKTAGLWKKGGPWTTNPKRMLKMRARAFAIRDGAADVLRGFQIREEVEDYGEALPVEPQRQGGTGLLAKLQTTETLATEGFGIRDVSDEAGEASPAPEPPKKRPRKKAVDEALNAAGEELANEALSAIAEAEPEIVAQVVEDHGEASDQAEEVNTPADPENLPADAQVEETATVMPENAIDAPAPADTIYFLAGEEPFASGRRAVWYNGKPNGSEDAAGDFPTYTQHTGETPARPTSTASVQTAETGPASSDSAPPASSDSAEATSGQTESDDRAQISALTPFEVFDAKAQTATDWETLHGALVALTRSDEWKADPEQKRAARLKTWAIVAKFNEGGAKIDPVSDPFLLACFIEASTDTEVIEATLPLAREQSWFEAGGEAMQAGVARAVLDRVTALKGG